MSRSSVLIVLGVLVILAPYSGLPLGLRTLLDVVLGLAVLGIGLTLRAREAHRAAPEVSAAPAPVAPPEMSPM